MLIKEACGKTGLTKKAIAYYEEKNLIRPQILENGYRDYSEGDISVLREILVLRKCGIPIADIGGILESPDKPAVLAKYRYITDIRIQKLEAIQKCMADMIDEYDVDRVFHYLQAHEEDFFTMKERLALAFPGSYGLYMALHFGRFLNGFIDTEEKRNAYGEIIRYLDTVDLYLPPELSEFLETVFAINGKSIAEQIESETSASMMEALADMGNYSERNRKDIEKYLEYRNSDEYKESPAAALQKLLMHFQKESGYQEIFIRNMQILSPSYAEYMKKLEDANAIFIDKFPQGKDL